MSGTAENSFPFSGFFNREKVDSRYKAILLHEHGHKKYIDKIYGEPRHIFGPKPDRTAQFLYNSGEVEPVADLYSLLAISVVEKNFETFDSKTSWRASNFADVKASHTPERVENYIKSHGMIAPTLKRFREWFEVNGFQLPDSNRMTEQEILDWSFDMAYGFWIHECLSAEQKETRKELLEKDGVKVDYSSIKLPMELFTEHQLAQVR